MRIPPIAVVQHLETVWTKASRGGVDAVRRNQTPDAVVFPCFLGFHSEEFRFGVHLVLFTERTGFQFDDTVAFERGSVWKKGCVRLVADNDILHVHFEYDGRSGAPTREVFDPTGNRVLLKEEAFCLQIGEWGRVSYNGRFSCEDTGNWWYEKTVFNIGMALRAEEDWFVHSTPNHVYSRMAQLR